MVRMTLFRRVSGSAIPPMREKPRMNRAPNVSGVRAKSNCRSFDFAEKRFAQDDTSYFACLLIVLTFLIILVGSCNACSRPAGGVLKLRGARSAQLPGRPVLDAYGEGLGAGFFLVGAAGAPAVEAALQQAHEAGVPVAEDEEDEEWGGEVVLVGEAVEDG
jgi:hypothetical protein